MYMLSVLAKCCNILSINTPFGSRDILIQGSGAEHTPVPANSSILFHSVISSPRQMPKFQSNEPVCPYLVHSPDQSSSASLWCNSLRQLAEMAPRHCELEMWTFPISLTFAVQFPWCLWLEKVGRARKCWKSERPLT